MRLDGTEAQLAMLREIAEALSDPVFLVDQGFNVWYHNRAFELSVGVRMSSKRYQGVPCHQLLNLSICEKSCIMQQAVQYKKEVRLADIQAQTSGGHARGFNVTAIPVFNERGAALGALLILRDVTEEAQVQRKYRDLVQKNSAISLSGQIEGGNLPDIVQLFTFLQKTGVLTLSASGHEGSITFERGQMVAITCGEASGEKAMGRLVAWNSAAFSFRPSEQVEVASRLSKSSDFLLMDALREKDEVGAVMDPPALDARLQLTRAVDPATEALDELTASLTRLAARGATVAEALAELPATDARILLTLASLRKAGLIGWSHD